MLLIINCDRSAYTFCFSFTKTVQFSCIVAQESVTTTVIRGSKTLKLTAILSGGNGDNAWQQAQLFSQPINDNDSSLEITITLQGRVVQS